MGATRFTVAVDYLDALQRFHAAGGKNVKDFLDQHTLPQQTTPGAPNPATPGAAPGPAVSPPVTSAPMVPNVVRQSMAPPPPAPTGAVGALPRSPINSRNLYPPDASQGRILGTEPAAPTVMQPAQPNKIAPAPMTPAPMMPLGTAPAQPSVVNPTAGDPKFADMSHDFRSAGEQTTGKSFMRPGEIDEHDFQTPGEKSAARTLPRKRNQSAVTVPPIFGT